MRIKYCSAPCGSGKTFQIVNRACDLARHGNKVLILQPTRELIDKTVKEELQGRPIRSHFRVFHRGTVGEGQVAKALADYVQDATDIPQIVFATHQVLPHVKHFANKDDWHVMVDEELQVVRHQQHRIPQTHGLITKHLEVIPANAVYGRIFVRDITLDEMARNTDQDEILETLADTCRILTNKNWVTFVNLEQLERLNRGDAKVLAFHSILKPEILTGFEEVLMATANFEDTGIYKVWGEQGVKFEAAPDFAKGLRYREHPNGELVTIHYATEKPWSRKRRDSVSGPGGITIQEQLIQASKELIGERSFVWHGNTSVPDDAFGMPAKRLPSKPHGLNTFADINHIAFLSSLNPASDHFRFLETQGLTGDEVRASTYYSAAYQAVMRTSIRDPENRKPKNIIVPDRGLADYLHNLFPRSRIQKLDIGLEETPPRKPGRTKRHHSNRDRVAAQRQKATEERCRVLAEQIRLNFWPDTVTKEDCGGRGESCAEIGIRLITQIGTQLCSASIFKAVNSPNPIGYVSGENINSFADWLRDLHSHQISAKDDNFLFSPAIFDPDRVHGSKRGLSNIVYLRHIVLDFENGDLRPEELPKLFPYLRMVVMNSYRHTTNAPRFRVVIPTTEIMTPEAYGLIYEFIAAKLEEAGHFVDRKTKSRTRLLVSNTRRSGLDWSMSQPTSIFYLPRQAKDSCQSFFDDYAEPPRQLLTPSAWIQNTAIPLQPEAEPLPSHGIHQVGLNEWKVQSAIEKWRTSSSYPGEGGRMFFELGLSLRGAGTHLHEVESTLRTEAQFGRTPKERLAQIPSIMQSLRRYFALAN
jgi:hypothetical protein